MANDRRSNRDRARRDYDVQGAHSRLRSGAQRSSRSGVDRNASSSARRNANGRGRSDNRRSIRATANRENRPRVQHDSHSSSSARTHGAPRHSANSQARAKQPSMHSPSHSRDTQDVPLSSGAQSYSRAKYGNSAAEYSADKYRSRSHGTSRRKKIIIVVAAALVLVLAGLGIAAARWYNNISTKIKGSQQVTNLTAPAADEPYYVLLMGSDNREGFEEITEENEGSRSDSIMVARVDEKGRKVSIISVPRDLRVTIPGQGYKKINSCIEYGGYEMLVGKLNEILNIKINYYATVYFIGFQDLVDTLGGVTVAVPEGTASPEGEILPVGEEVELNGEQALILARCRHGIPEDQGVYAMGDYQRTLNQRNLIKAIANKVLEQDITKMPALVESLSKCVESNMSIDKIIAMAQNMKGMDTETIESAQLPIGASTIDEQWEALMYQDVYELMIKNFAAGEPLFTGLDGFDTEFNDDDVGTDYIDGPVYSYTTYTAHVGRSPYSSGYTPSDFTQEAIAATKAKK